jgi:hypothetical protein
MSEVPEVVWVYPKGTLKLKRYRCATNAGGHDQFRFPVDANGVPTVVAHLLGFGEIKCSECGADLLPVDDDTPDD